MFSIPANRAITRRVIRFHLCLYDIACLYEKFSIHVKRGSDACKMYADRKIMLIVHLKSYFRLNIHDFPVVFISILKYNPKKGWFFKVNCFPFYSLFIFINVLLFSEYTKKKENEHNKGVYCIFSHHKGLCHHLCICESKNGNYYSNSLFTFSVTFGLLI